VLYRCSKGSGVASTALFLPDNSTPVHLTPRSGPPSGASICRSGWVHGQRPSQSHRRTGGAETVNSMSLSGGPTRQLTVHISSKASRGEPSSTLALERVRRSPWGRTAERASFTPYLGSVAKEGHRHAVCRCSPSACPRREEDPRRRAPQWLAPLFAVVRGPALHCGGLYVLPHPASRAWEQSSPAPPSSYRCADPTRRNRLTVR
jgi:hypothetical protein